MKFIDILFQAKSEGIGGGWMTGQSDVDRRSDVDTDYRREMVKSVHSEARGRDGGGGNRRDLAPPPSIYKQAASLNRREIEISQVGDSLRYSVNLYTSIYSLFSRQFSLSLSPQI